MRFHAQAIAPQLAEAGAAMGIVAAGQSDEALASAAAHHVANWVAAMHLPSHLRELGIKERQLPDLARIAFASRTVQNDPRPIGDVAEIEALLREAW
jgi:alcohol dehydrogenase class IV